MKIVKLVLLKYTLVYIIQLYSIYNCECIKELKRKHVFFLLIVLLTLAITGWWLIVNVFHDGMFSDIIVQ